MAIHDLLKEEIIAPLVDELMATEYSVPPPNPLVSPSLWKDQKRKELMDLFSGQKEMDRINAAIEIFRAEFQANFSVVEREKFQKEWDQGIERIQHLLEEDPQAPVAPLTSLRELMNLSESTLERLYSIGVKYYKSQDFTKAADLFFLLTQIDPHRYNIWISLGLSEMKAGQFEPALYAFALAILTKKELPYPYLYSAECCLALERPQECISYLNLAKEGLTALPLKEKESLLNSIRILEQKSKL